MRARTCLLDSTRDKMFGGTMTTFWLTAVFWASITAHGADFRLLDAVRDGDAKAIHSLLDQHVDVNAAQPDGATALALAAHEDDLASAELLIRAGADVNRSNEYGETPLSLACANGNARLVGVLVKAGANVNAARWSGETPLMVATRVGSMESVKLLLEAGAEPNAKESERGQTPLMWEATRNQLNSVQR